MLARCLVRLSAWLIVAYAFEPREATIDSVHNAIFSRTATCRQIISSFLTRIETINPKINSLISLNPSVLKQADELDRLIISNAGSRSKSPLFCVPVLLKDNYDTVDMPTTGACLDLAALQPTSDAPVVQEIRRAGALILGKTSMHELALEGLSVSSLGGQVLNPYDLTRTPGGSSGGSGAAIAASLAVFATGTDTVNSVRSPPASNSLVSVRPTRGLISRTGVIPISYTQDALGPITRSVRDAAVALSIMARVGFDPEDNVTALAPLRRGAVDYTQFLSPNPKASLKGLRLGLIRTFFAPTPTSETQPVDDVFTSVVTQLRSAGATIVDIVDPVLNSSDISTKFDVQQFEFQEGFDIYISRPNAFASTSPAIPTDLTQIYTASSKYLVIPAQYNYVNNSLSPLFNPSSSIYLSKQRGIENLTLHLSSVFHANSLDALIYPEQANLVVRVGAPSQSGRNGILAAVTGSPVVVVPAGFSPHSKEAPRGVPIGMEILGRPFEEGKLLGIAQGIESLLRVRIPPMLADIDIPGRTFETVPKVVPDRGNLDVSAYPIGVRG